MNDLDKELIRNIVRHHDQTLAPKGEYENLLDETVAKIQALIVQAREEERQAIADEIGKMQEIQGVDGTWNYDPYMHGMYNGIEFCHALAKDTEPKYRKAPKKWLVDIPFPENADPTPQLQEENK